MPANCRSDYFLPALWADACRNIFDDDKVFFDPKILVDEALNHLFTTNVAIAIIIFCVIHEFPRS